MNRTTMSLTLTLTLSLAAPAFGQTVYKCPPTTPTGTPVIQQMPCSPTGGGETIRVTAPKPGRDGGLRESEKSYMAESSGWLKERADTADAEKKRQEVIDVERDKARAAENQARATWYLGSAILMRR